MSEFINTVDILGDDEVIDSILNGTIIEFKDNIAKTLRSYAFYNCKNLVTVDLPNVTGCSESTRGLNVFTNCTSLVNVNLPKFDTHSSNNIQRMFQGCTSLEDITFPSLTNNGYGMFENCKNLKKVDFFKVTYIHQGGFSNTALKTLLIRSDVVCGLNPSNVFYGTPIASGTGCIYVPRALLEDYKVATNWSTYATQFRALEDYTVDGTTTGELATIYNIVNSLIKVTTSNTAIDAKENDAYFTILTSVNTSPVENVVVTMGGIDITAEVYNAETGEINIPAVTGDIAISAKAMGESDHDYELLPTNGIEGDLPFLKLNVIAGQTITLTYYLTKRQGYIYDGRKCGMQYYGSVIGSAYPMPSSDLSTEVTKTITVVSDGTITFSGNQNDTIENGEFSPNANDRLYGAYMYIDIE